MKKDKVHIDKLFSEVMNQRAFDVPESFIEDLNIRLDAEEKKKNPFFWWLAALLGGICLLFTVFLSIQPYSFQGSNSPQLPGSTYIRKESYPLLSLEINYEKTILHTNLFQTTNPDKQVLINQIVSLTGTKKQSYLTLPAHKANQKKPAKHKKSVRYADIQNGEEHEKIGNTFFESTTNPIKEVEVPYSEEPDSMVVSEKKKDTVLSVIFVDNTADQPVVSAIPNDKIENVPNANWEKEIQLFGGLGANFVKDSPVNKTYLEKLDENQVSILAASFGVNGNLSYKKFTFGLGFSYSQTGEKTSADIQKYHWKDSTVSEHIIDTILVLDTLGNWVPQIHDTTIHHSYQFQDSTSERTSFKNTYSWISIPLHFGYRFGLGKYEVIPRIGAQFNFGTSRNKGRFPNENFNGVLEYRAVKFNISYLIQLEVRRNFNRWHVFINPYFKSMINPAISNNLIRRQYASWGIHFGVGFKL